MAPMRCSEQDVYTVVVTSPIGDIEIRGCDGGLHSVKQCDEDDSTFSPDEGRPVNLKRGYSKIDCKPIDECISWLKKYFLHKEANIKIPSLCSSVVRQDSFAEKAWRLLPEAAPMGTTISYKDLAEWCGSEKACRAAGQAMATNPVSLLIPCHRVISSQGKLGNYSHGKKNKIKKWLLKYERREEQ
ncbi:methylated-DNA--protein-cysteine methyltransferase [Aplysia californica]|uniref:Methylated-DNA--protein-cysteine methyltransferase n=1 Tax=Aplysia californica TaxID=6500 RepID=A0ABM1VVM2_APLCA|nr:methylated-DNA--protein-cysteine methyltransferase [Aplysia californica]